MLKYNFPQYSIDWWMARRGIPTASNFDRIITPAKGKLSTAADEYIYELLGEKYTEPPVDFYDYMSKDMAHGLQFEAEARKWYAMTVEEEVTQVGFITTDCGRFGCSPDALVGEEGGSELKCPSAKTQIKYLVEAVLPNQYKTQVHGSLAVSKLKWWDFISYHRGLPAFKIRVFPDEYTALLENVLEQFHQRYLEIDNIIKGLRND